MKRFKDKVALVSGAASGIGLATAKRLGAEGASLMLLDINEAGLQKVENEFKQEGIAVAAKICDVSKKASCDEAVAATIAAFGSLDVVCNIAGFTFCEHFLDITEEAWTKMIDVNLSGVFFMCQAAMPELLKSKGNVVNLASTAGLTGQAYTSPYSATKAGVVMLSKSLALEFAGREVRVNAICPGGVNTPLSAAFSPPQDADNGLLGRLFPLLPAMAEPEEIAAAIAWIASEEGKFVTGAAIPLDGGQTAG